MTTVDDVLTAARTRGVDRLDAQLLLGHVLQKERAWLLAHTDAALDESQSGRIDELLSRRSTGEPLAYLVGEKEFHGLVLKVSPAVLVPRPDTETLVDWAMELLRDAPPASVLDLGTGSGAIALAIKARRSAARITALDASADALAIAKANGERLGLEVRWLLSDWWAGVVGERFDLIVTNPPYIAAADPHLAALQHEPQSALVSGPDGLADLHRIIASASTHLHPGGWLLLEHGYDQGDDVMSMLQSAGFDSVTTRHDLGGQPRCTGGRAA